MIPLRSGPAQRHGKRGGMRYNESTVSRAGTPRPRPPASGWPSKGSREELLSSPLTPARYAPFASVTISQGRVAVR